MCGGCKLLFFRRIVGEHCVCGKGVLSVVEYCLLCWGSVEYAVGESSIVKCCMYDGVFCVCRRARLIYKYV